MSGTTGLTEPTTTTTTSSTSISQGSSTQGGGGDVGEKIKGGFGVIHGAGEALRGTINNFLDSAGEGIAGRSDGTTATTGQTAVKRGDGGVASADVANNGVGEMQRGMDALKK